MRLFAAMTLLLTAFVCSACGSKNDDANLASDEAKVQENLETLSAKLQAMGLHVSSDKRHKLGDVGVAAVNKAFADIEAVDPAILESLKAAAAQSRIHIYFGQTAKNAYFDGKYEMHVDAKFFARTKEYSWTDDAGVFHAQDYNKFIRRQIKLIVAMANADTKEWVETNSAPTSNGAQVFYRSSDSDFNDIVRQMPTIKSAALRTGTIVVLSGVNPSSESWEVKGFGGKMIDYRAFNVVDAGMPKIKALLDEERIASGNLKKIN